MLAILEFIKAEWKWLLLAAVVGTVLGLTVHLTRKVDKADVIELQHEVKDASAAAAEAQGALQTNQARKSASDKVDASMAQQTAKKEVIYRDVIKEVTKYVENPAIPACSLDDQWVLQYNRSLEGGQGSVPDSASSPAAESGTTGTTDKPD